MPDISDEDMQQLAGLYGHCHHQLSIKPFYKAPASWPAVFLAIILRAQLALSQIEIKASKALANT